MPNISSRSHPRLGGMHANASAVDWKSFFGQVC